MAVARGAVALRVVQSPDAWQRAWRGFERSLRADSAVKSTRTIDEQCRRRCALSSPF
jgi:hypothetical protein